MLAPRLSRPNVSTQSLSLSSPMPRPLKSAIRAGAVETVQVGREPNASPFPRPPTCPNKVSNAQAVAILSIYVEISIRGNLDELWRRTQVPELHERWDLRFTSIEYLERADGSAAQQFRYATRIGFGKEIEGWGETVGERLDANTRTSALKFGSDDRRSLIRAGSGYWKYEQIGEEVRFVTGYDYDVRWGLLGRAIDRMLFRPLLGWATAWSFDRLRLWIEEGREPEEGARRALIHALAAATIALVWIWQGTVPKLAGPHPEELALIVASGVPEQWGPAAARLLGAGEVLFGFAFLLWARRRWPWLLNIGMMVFALAAVTAAAPEKLAGPFSPFVLNLLLVVLAAIGLLSLRGLPSARRCQRRPPGDASKETAP